MAPRKQRPGYVQEGQYLCRAHIHDPQTGTVSGICQKPVPAGELPHLAHNSPSGDWLVLCMDCRAKLGAQVEDWLAASIGTARLLAELVPLSSGHLISESELRERLVEAGCRDLGKRGPLSAGERQLGMRLMAQRWSAKQ